MDVIFGWSPKDASDEMHCPDVNCTEAALVSGDVDRSDNEGYFDN